MKHRNFKNPILTKRRMSAAQKKKWRRIKAARSNLSHLVSDAKTMSETGNPVEINDSTMLVNGKQESVRMLARFIEAVKEENLGYAETFRALKWFRKGWESNNERI